MKHMFLEKFFSTSRIATIRKEICGIRQHSGETLHEYWERFNKLCATCPHHQISKQLLIQYFYEGLMMIDQSMIDATSGGALMDKTSAAIRHLVSNMARASQPQMVNELGAVDNLRMENQLTEFTSFVRQLVVGQHQPGIAARVCGMCTSVEHPTNMCSILQETESDHQRVVTSTERSRIKVDHLIISSLESNHFGPGGAPLFQQQQHGMLVQGTSPSLEDLMKQLTVSNLEFQQTMSSSNMQF
ncbi:hypothetical protein CR513_20488, partial [Mucuna pruriens]